MIVRRHDPADDRRRRLHDQPAHLAAQLGEHPLVFLRRRLARLDDDLFRGGNRALRLLFLHALGDRAGVGEELRRLRLCLGHRLLALRFDAGERGVDLLGVLETLRDLLAAFVEQAQHGPVGKAVENGADNAEADDLRDEMRPVDAEGPRDFLDLTSVAGLH